MDIYIGKLQPHFLFSKGDSSLIQAMIWVIKSLVWSFRVWLLGFILEDDDKSLFRWISYFSYCPLFKKVWIGFLLHVFLGAIFGFRLCSSLEHKFGAKFRTSWRSQLQKFRRWSHCSCLTLEISSAPFWVIFVSKWLY